jgi:hypothetical protein
LFERTCFLWIKLASSNYNHCSQASPFLVHWCKRTISSC